MADAGDQFTVPAIILAMFATVGAGIITTEAGQKALKAAKQARYLAPTDIFVLFSLAAFLLAVMSKKFPVLKEYPAACMMFACSSMADIILECPAFAWIVYAPSAFLLLASFLPNCFHTILFNQVTGAAEHIKQRLNYIWFQRIETCPIIGPSAMAIRERLMGNLHEDIPL